MERDIPEVVAEVTERFLEYERALIDGDLAAMKDTFAEDDHLVRFGINDQEHGPEELAKWRASQPPLPPGRTLSNTVVSTYGNDFAVVITNFHYPNRSIVGRQSQTWIREGGTWVIVHAHVSEVPAAED